MRPEKPCEWKPISRFAKDAYCIIASMKILAIKYMYIQQDAQQYQMRLILNPEMETE